MWLMYEHIQKILIFVKKQILETMENTSSYVLLNSFLHHMLDCKIK